MTRWLPLVFVLVVAPRVVRAQPPGDDGEDETETESETETETETETEPETETETAEPEAEPDTLTPGAETAHAPHSAAAVAGAPLPGQESGRVDAGKRHDGTMRKVARGILFLPNALFEAVLTPVRLGVWAYDRYHVDDLVRRLFFNKSGTVGLFPILQFDSQYFVNVGLRFLDLDTFGAGEELNIWGVYGGPYREWATARLTSGERFGDRIRLEGQLDFERRPRDPFWGLGNQAGAPQILAFGIPVEPILEARFRQEVFEASVIGDVRLFEELHVGAQGSIAKYKFAQSTTGVPIEILYPPQALVGFEGFTQAYAELEVRWDTRRRMTVWEPPAVRSHGSLVDVFGGRIFGIDNSASFWRVGFDLQRFIRIAPGPRFIVGRLYGEGVSGSISEVQFTQLPRLGGWRMLRGYPLDRFRDRIAAMASAEYSWDLSRQLQAALFVDAGRVYRSLEKLTLDDFRVGFGFGIEVHTHHRYLFRASITSSIDGGAFVEFAFNPTYDLPPRVRRR